MKSIARDSLAQGYAISPSSEDFDRAFPLVRQGRAVTHVGIADGPSLGLADHLVIGWWQLEQPADPTNAAIERALAQLFASCRGEAPADTAVGILIAFDERWGCSRRAGSRCPRCR